MTNDKLICVVGATGNQGGSVARRFLKAGFKVRGLTRNTASPSAQALSSAGAEVVAVDLNDVSTLKSAFAGANVIFSVTNYWEPFFRPDCREQAAKEGISCRKFAYNVEVQQGKNIVDAAATVVDTLDDNGFLVSTLSQAEKCSGGKFKELYHFDGKADVFPAYVDEKYPELAAKMSCIHTGYFFTSFNILPDSYMNKLPDGTFEMSFTTSPDSLVPHLDPVGDLGNFTYAVYQMPPGKAYMAEGTTCTWPEWIETWGRINNVPVKYRQVTPDEMTAATPDRDAGIETGYMFSYTSDPGYDGGMKLLKAKDIREIKLSRLRKYLITRKLFKNHTVHPLPRLLPPWYKNFNPKPPLQPPLQKVLLHTNLRSQQPYLLQPSFNNRITREINDMQQRKTRCIFNIFCPAMIRVDAENDGFCADGPEILCRGADLAGYFIVVACLEETKEFCVVEGVEEEFGGVAAAETVLDVGVYLFVVEEGCVVGCAAEKT
ncbi:nitrogen metabolic regulation nmr [Fusarium acutatum]|uniref:Nitrogen metabolic regulation nmr n=1 Tax=Fusarium acutatum TaxID=78861 RepID=A0A8H4NIQ1_9HYPO|nr:nitrogen metabolic regulation nmr [Fusarium acutatum]